MNASTEKIEELALYVVATPIGNLQDLSKRAALVLTQAGLIAAEDTRHTRRLLAHIGSQAPLISAHAHNERASAPRIIRTLAEGKICALVSDAGTPAISDPGARLVHAVREAGYPVIPVPGASATIGLLSAAGIDADRFGPDADRFLFAGFLPTKSNARLESLRQLRRVAATIVVLESPKRIESLVEALIHVFGADRTVVLGRELTKKFEQIVSLPAAQLQQWLRQDPNRRRGEFVLAIAPAIRKFQSRNSDSVVPNDQATADTPIQFESSAGELMLALSEFLPPAKAAKLARQLSGLKQDELYSIAVEQRADRIAEQPANPKPGDR